MPNFEYRCITAVDCTIAKTRKDILDNRYLNFTLNSVQTLKEVNKYLTGTTRKRISRTNFLTITVEQGNKVVFYFDATDELYQAINDYNSGTTIEAVRFALAIKNLKSQIQSARNNKENNSKNLFTIKTLRFLLPRRHRKEFADDIQEIYYKLVNEGHPRFWMYTVLLLNIANVFWTVLRFKYDNYFEEQSFTGQNIRNPSETPAQNEKKDSRKTASP